MTKRRVFVNLTLICEKGFLLLCFIVPGVRAADPCTDYIEINDTTLTTTNIPSDVASITCQSFTPLNWYRYTGTDDGLLTNQCPTGLQCGSDTQIWINDSFPIVSDGEKLVNICVHKNNSCCSSKNKLSIKNCTTFLVYFFIPTPAPMCVNYCFFDDEPPPVTVDPGKLTTDPGKVNTPGSTNNDTSGSTNNDTPGSTNNDWVLPVVVSVVCVIIAIAGVVITTIVCKLKNKRKQTVGVEVAKDQYHASGYH
ncbi:hypothetical protein ACF0H5_015791 [Mactra antiquata]